MIYRLLCFEIIIIYVRYGIGNDNKCIKRRLMPSWTSSNTFLFFPLIIERKNDEKHQLLHLAPRSVTSRPIGSMVGWDVTGPFVKELLNHEMELKSFFPIFQVNWTGFQMWYSVLVCSLCLENYEAQKQKCYISPRSPLLRSPYPSIRTVPSV